MPGSGLTFLLEPRHEAGALLHLDAKKPFTWGARGTQWVECLPLARAMTLEAQD